MIKLLAIDLDGTLLNAAGEISPRALHTLGRAAALGVEVLPVTGRMYQSALPIALRMPKAQYLICCQGSIAYRISTGEILFIRPVPFESARRVLAFLKERGRFAQIYDPEGRYYERACPESEFYDKLSGTDGVAAGDLLAYMDFEPLKILTFRDERVPAFESECFERFSRELCVTVSSAELLEFTGKEATKGLALESFAGMCGLCAEQIMAIGDSYNDIPMLEYAGLGVAMGNAPEGVKRVADAVTAPNGEDGAALAIEKYILGGADGKS